MKAIYVIISITATALLAPVASALIINIPGDYSTIQEGIDASTDGDTVLVAPGLYVETVTIENKNILLTSAEGPDNTSIKGFVFFEAGVDTTCVFRGFTVIPDPESEWYERRALINIENCSPLIEGNIAKDGYNFQYFGGGVMGIFTSAIIRNNIIKDNRAPMGGGIDIGGAEALIERNIISNNTAFTSSHGADGGGISMSEGTVRFNLIIDNEAFSGYPSVIGGGIYMYTTSLPGGMIYNNTIVGNSARFGPYDQKGGGVYFVTRSDYNEGVFFKNNIIAFNPYGGGVYVRLADSVEVDWDYNLVFGNDSTDYIGIEPGPHDIQADPLFVNRFSGDYHLLPNSPCIDAGDPDSPLDPDGTRADIGAYYFDQTVGIEDPGEPSGPYKFQLRQNYPNPFNAQTIISYTLSESSAVSLMIFAITGHFVNSIVNKEVQPGGEYRYIWNGEDKSGQRVATGIYFYELYVDDYRESKAMIMVK